MVAKHGYSPARVPGRLEREPRATPGVRTVVRVEPTGKLPRTEFKARRVVDSRDLYRSHASPASLELADADERAGDRG